MVPLKPNKMIEREIELAAKGTASYMGREERDCLRRAAAAEAAFRAPPRDTSRTPSGAACAGG